MDSILRLCALAAPVGLGALTWHAAPILPPIASLACGLLAIAAGCLALAK